MENILETKSLTKRYGDKIAVNKVSLHVRRGDIYGLIGKNGAGKTSLMKLLLGLTLPDSGKMCLLNEPNANHARSKIGSLIEAPALYKNETAFENMKRFAILSPTSDREIQNIQDLVGLGNTGMKKAGAFSLGMRQRLGIAIALLGKPEVLILDEPINGLDPAGIKEIRDIIIELNHRGVTFLISSHLLDELGKIATNYGIMSNSALVEEITAETLAARCRTSLKLTTDNAQAALDVLKQNFTGILTETNAQTIYITSPVSDASAINETLVKAGLRVYEITNESIGFEDFFIERLGR